MKISIDKDGFPEVKEQGEPGIEVLGVKVDLSRAVQLNVVIDETGAYLIIAGKELKDKKVIPVPNDRTGMNIAFLLFVQAVAEGNDVVQYPVKHYLTLGSQSDNIPITKGGESK